ncbi:MAG: hypothetical protein HC865_10550 [Cyanobacteria bacterium RU_5_0]|nr:hypothetical protein [Cyanobacteria bacterium RU_5_0]
MSGKTFCIWRDRWQFIRQFTRYNWYVGELRPIDFAPDGRGQTDVSALYVRANTSVCPYAMSTSTENLQVEFSQDFLSG